MIVINVQENMNILQKDIILQKKMINILMSLCKQFNNKHYLYNFKDMCINIVNTTNKLINYLINNSNLCNGIDISKIKLNCVVVITSADEYEAALYGDCEDTSIKLTLVQLLYFYLNSIINTVINFCLEIQHNMSIEIENQYNVNIETASQYNTNIETVKQCLKKIKSILENINNLSIQELHPICKKFNYSVVDNIMHEYIEPLLKQIK